MLINNDISFSKVELEETIHSHPSLEIQAISLKLEAASFLLLNVYRHPSIKTSTFVLNNLLDFCNTFTYYLMIGDFNAHHTHWYNEYDDHTGKIINQLIEANGLVILNEGPPTLIPAINHIHSNIVIDLALASVNLARYCNTNTFDDCLGSDHFPVLTRIGGNFLPRKRFVYKFNLGAGQLATFSKLCKEHPANLINMEESISGTDAYDTFIGHIKRLIYSLIPEKARNPRTRSNRNCCEAPPWWTYTRRPLKREGPHSTST